MKRLVLTIASVCALAAAVPAWATSAHTSKGKGTCAVHKRGYRARGTLVSATLTPTTRKHHYDGTITVEVTRANHKAPTGSQTFTLTNAKVTFGKGVTPSSTSSGDRVKLSGKITETKASCSTGSSGTITIHTVVIKAPQS